MFSRILHDASLVISFVKARLDSSGKIIDAKTQQDLQRVAANLVRAIDLKNA